MQLTIRRKLIISFSVVIIIMIATCIFGMSSLRSFHSRLNLITDNVMPDYEMTMNIRLEIAQYRLAEYKYISFYDSTNIEDAVQRLHAHRARLEELMAEYGEGLESDINETEIQVLAQMQQNWADYVEISEQMMRLKDELDRQGALNLIAGSSFQLFNAIEAQAQELSGINETIVQQNSSVIRDSYDDTQRTLILILSALVILCALQAFLVSRSITNPINSLAQTLIDISEGEGDLTVQLPARGRDELTVTSHAFNKFVQVLHSTVQQIRDKCGSMGQLSQNLTLKTGTIKNDINNISAGIDELNFKTEEQAASATETSATIQQIAQNISNLTSQIEQQSTSVIQSSAAIQQMISNINSIAHNLNRARDDFNQLRTTSSAGHTSIANMQELVLKVSNQSSNLLETNLVIESIASQTNLLAMNAAIEAAHAGDSGKGFAVVADEIRKLAEDTTSQSKSIAEELQTIVENIGTIVAATTQAESSFEMVVQQIADSNNLVEEISHAMKEQSESSQQVLKALKNMQDFTIQIRDGSVEMSEGASVILNEMQRLMDVSQQVQQNSLTIARAVDAINSSIDSINSDSNQNNDSVQVLLNLTNKFKL